MSGGVLVTDATRRESGVNSGRSNKTAIGNRQLLADYTRERL